MSLHKEDKRSKKVVFVANCLLNANNKVLEQARYKGMFFEVIKILNDFGIGVIQMPCPETLYFGNKRWWTSRNLYDNAGYRNFCRNLCCPLIDYLYNYEQIGYETVAVLTCDGSPSCGITKSSYCEDWGGRPKEIPRILVDKPGIFTEEFIKLGKERNIKIPYIYGLLMDDHEKTNEEILNEFKKFISENISDCKQGGEVYEN